MGFTWIANTKPSDITPPPSGVIEVLYIYDTTGTADDDMRLNDTALKGCSEFAAVVNALTDSNGNTYNITEIAETTFIANVASALTGIDVLITGTAIDDYTGTPASDLATFVETNGKGILMYSDGSFGGGADNTVGADSRRSMGCMNWGFDCAPDQKSGVVLETTPASSILGDSLQFEGEGVSPWVRDSNSANWTSQGNPTVLVAKGTQSLSKTAGLTYNGTITQLGYSEPGTGRVVFLFDRQLLWNTGSVGSDISKFDNQELLENIIKWLAKQT